LLSLEIEALYRLHQAGATLGEQVTLSRTSGRLRVDALVDSENRKQQLLRALETVKSNPAAEIHIKTINEALQEQTARSSGPMILRDIEAGSNRIPAYDRLMTLLSNSNAVQDYANRAVDLTQKIQTRAWALKRLASTFPASERERLAPSSRMQWDEML